MPEYVTQEIDTNCELDPDVWGAITPGSLLAEQRFWTGIGPMSDDFQVSFREAVEDAGYDWECDWQPFVYSNWFGLQMEDGFVRDETNYAISYELDQNRAIVYGSDGNPSMYALDGNPPEQTLVWNAPWALWPSEFLFE